MLPNENYSQVFLKTFEQLSKIELYQLLALRSKVFCVEQDCPYQDVDNQDIKAQHVFINHHDNIVAYARITQSSKQIFHISRVVVDDKHRKHKLATLVITAAIEQIRQQITSDNSNILISAQSYLKDFYYSFGFKSTGSFYLEDDIPHEKMQLLLN